MHGGPDDVQNLKLSEPPNQSSDQTPKSGERDMMHRFLIEGYRELTRAVQGASRSKNSSIAPLHGDHRALIHPKGKEAILHYERIGSHETQIELVTGYYIHRSSNYKLMT